VSCRPPVRAGQRYERGERAYEVLSVPSCADPFQSIELRLIRIGEQDRSECEAFFQHNRVGHGLESIEQVEAALLATTVHVDAPWFGLPDVREVLL
jgi:hypothetical protein